ncbi:MAG: Crp/Fnr family transcriptional regulator [Sandaracinaceae bacterium]
MPQGLATHRAHAVCHDTVCYDTRMTTTPRPYRAAKRGAPIEDRLAAFGFAEGLDPETRRRLLAAITPAHFDRETALVRPHDDVRAIPLVERGVIHVRRDDPSGRVLALYDVQPGESCVLALAGALRGGLYPAEAVAAPGTDALLIDADALRDAFARDEHLQQFVLDLYSARFIDMMKLVREVAFDRLDVRLARLLLGESDAGPGMTKPVELSHTELAARLGSAREAVSRTLGRFRREGFVEVHRSRTVITDAAGLAERYGITGGAGDE